jgi:hypothetical protein
MSENHMPHPGDTRSLGSEKGQNIGLTFGAAYQNLYTVEYGSLENRPGRPGVKHNYRMSKKKAPFWDALIL